MNSTFRISYDRAPPGAATSTVSPLPLPIRARAMGEESEIRPFLASDLHVADDLVFALLVGVLVDQGDGRAELHAVVPDSLETSITSARPIWSSSSMTRPSMKLWRLLGGVIFGIFRQIAMGARFRDRLDDRVAFHVLELVHLVFQGFEARGGHGNSFHGTQFP